MSDADAQTPPETPETPGDDAQEGEWQVLLRDGDPTALVRTPTDHVDNVPILTATKDEDPEQVTRNVDHDYVLLQEGEDHATARIRDVTRGQVPLYKEQATAADEPPREIRVRVRQIREHAPKTDRKNVLKNLFKK